MAGLVAAARARELGAEVVVLEKGERAGGSMLLSSGVVWRHATLARFRDECPGGDPLLQRRVIEDLDAALEWLEALGAPVTARETGNERTLGRRFDPVGLTDALVRAAGEVRLGESFRAADVLATGGFGVRLARERGLLLRASPWSEGDGLDYGVARGAATTAGLDEFYGRALPGPVPEADFVRAAQLYARHAVVLDDEGRELGEPAWHESDLVQRFPGGRAWYVVDARALREPVRERRVADLVEAARAAGSDVRPAAELPFPVPASPKLAEPPFLAVRVYAAVTHTTGGLRIDERARVLREDGSPVPGLYAAGADAGGIFTGGYGSGLAAALVFGRIAAESALAA
jgi:fumarate reductase flavoprotein subunit